MFGYLCVNKPELKIREFEEYHSFYCGVCRELKRKFGLKGQIAVSYDSAFLALLLTGLYEPECKSINKRCIASPVKKNLSMVNTYSEYSADMNMFLNYYKCVYDWNDDRRYTKHIYSKLIHKRIIDIQSKYKTKCQRIEEQLETLNKLEHDDVYEIDAAAGCFGHVMEEIFDYSDDVWNSSLKRMGFYLGKFIYIMDAYEDIEEDNKSGSYNVLKSMYDSVITSNEDKLVAVRKFEDKSYNILSMMMAECSIEFEKLPVIMYADILRNILYSGVWCHFRNVTERRIKRYEETK